MLIRRRTLVGVWGIPVSGWLMHSLEHILTAARSLYVRVAQKQSIISEAWLCVAASGLQNRSNFFASLPFKKITFDGNFTNSGDKRKSNRKVFDIVNVDFKAGNGWFFSGHTEKMQLVRFQLRPFWVEFASLYVWCGWLFVSRNWPSPALTLSQPGSWLY